MDAERRKNLTFEKILAILKSNLRPEDDVTEKGNVGTVEMVFHIVSRFVAVFDAVP